MTPSSIAVRARRGAGRFASRLLVEPIREGRLVDTGWPPGLRVIVACSVGAFVLAVALVVASPLLRATLPLALSNGAAAFSLPRPLLPLFFALIVLSAALLQTAALHFRWVAALPITALTALLLLYLGGLDGGAVLDATPFTPGKIASLVAVAVLVVLLVIRRRRPFSWAEFALVLVLLGGTAVVALARAAAESIPFGLDFGPPTANILMGALGTLAAPAALAAGVAVAEFAIAAAFAIVATIRTRSAGAASLPLVQPRAAPLGLRDPRRLAAARDPPPLPPRLFRRRSAGRADRHGRALRPPGRRRRRALEAAPRRASGQRRRDPRPRRGSGASGRRRRDGPAHPRHRAPPRRAGPDGVGAGTGPALFAGLAVAVLSSSTVTLVVRTLVAVALVIAAAVLARRGRRGSPSSSSPSGS
ncbi:hypothetical protein [Naasia aerilata]|uniref:Uncharacterized protein n=1 Tax=Naasia aerilata TaxID=1162966 RepID=A0ABN6XR93_9MICO|nr:hypothetical protein [Naasia aerilata]BDZ47519.1 hypothetical protein GCM10025866_34280 [Naasia aerilata]